MKLRLQSFQNISDSVEYQFYRYIFYNFSDLHCKYPLSTLYYVIYITYHAYFGIYFTITPYLVQVWIQGYSWFLRVQTFQTIYNFCILQVTEHTGLTTKDETEATIAWIYIVSFIIFIIPCDCKPFSSKSLNTPLKDYFQEGILNLNLKGL